MQLKQELITRLIVTLGLVFIGGKIIAALFSTFRNSGSSKSNFKDIDRMIEHQKTILRHDQGFSAEPTKEIKTANRESKTKNAYSKIGDKNMVALIDGLQWGGGDEYSAISKKLNEQFNLQIDTTRLGQYLSSMINRDFLLKFNPLPARDQVDKLIELRAILESLFDEFAHDGLGGPCIEALSRQKNVGVWEMAKAVEMVLLSEEKSGNSLLKFVLEKNSASKSVANKKSEIILKQMMSGDKPANASLFISRIDRYLAQVTPFSPLPEMNDKNDVVGALKIFGFTDNPGDEELKKQYKKLASLRHPDKLAGMNLDPALSKRANDNFTRIQTAWDLLKK
jgi:hypothetical protein